MTNKTHTYLSKQLCVLVAGIAQRDKQAYDQLTGDRINMAGFLTNGLDIIQYCKSQKKIPDIIIIETGLAGFDCVQLSNYLFFFYPDIKIIIVTDPAVDIDASILEQAGARVLLEKKKGDAVSNRDFIQQLIAIVMEIGYPPIIDEPYYRTEEERARQHAREHADEQRKSFALSLIEYELTMLSTSGATYPVLGKILNKSPRTIETQVRKLNQKLGLSSGILSLALFSIRHRFSILPKTTAPYQLPIKKQKVIQADSGQARISNPE